MGVVLVILAVLVVLLGLGLLLGRRQAEQRTLTFTEPVRRAEVELGAGAVSFVPTDGPVRVHRTIRWALAKPVSSERVEDGVLRVEAGSQGAWLFEGEVSYRVEIPAGADVRASTRAGAVGVEAISGDVEVRTSAGQVTLANLSGRVRVTTQAGKVHGTGLASGDVEVQSNAGGLTLAFDAPPGRVQARTNAGSVELSVPDERYAVDASSSVGRVQLEVANDPDAPRRLLAHTNAGAVWVRRR
jgi:hypothetical protein